MTHNSHAQDFTARHAQTDGRLRQAQLKMLDMLKVIDDICTKHQLDYWLEGGTLLGAIRHQGFIPWDDDLDISMPRWSYDAFLKLAPNELPSHLVLQTKDTDKGFFNLSAPLKLRDKNSRFIEMHETGDEPYLQGIFIDVFVYDKLPKDAKRRKRSKWLTKKASRLLRPKYSSIPVGHNAWFYTFLSRFFSKSFLERFLNEMMEHYNDTNSPYMGYGYDCVNQNLVSMDDIYPLKRVTFENAQFNIANKAEVILTQLYGDYMQMPPESERVMKHCRQLIPNLEKVNGHGH